MLGLCLLLLANQSFASRPMLTPGKMVQESVVAGDTTIRTELLDERYLPLPKRAKAYGIRLERGGPHSISMNSPAFDTYLVLLDSQGRVLAEDDDGWVGSQSRMAIDLKAQEDYLLYACALHGAVGPFELSLQSGELQEMPEQERKRWQQDPRMLASELRWTAEGMYGEDPLAQKHLEEALQLAERKLGEQTWETARSLLGLGRLRVKQKEWNIARPLIERAIKVSENLLGPNDMQTCEAYQELGIVLAAQNETDRAKSMYEKALRGLEAKLPVEKTRMGREILLRLGELSTLLGNERQKAHYETLAKKLLESPTPTPEQIAWIKENAIPIRTAKADGNFDDLLPLKSMIGDARIVALGEATHGTREFFQMKHRITEFLAREMGFTIFAIEANMPEAYAVDEYIQTGKGDPATLIKGMYFWTWSTEEVLEMVQWMRQFHASGKGRIRFTGFDMQYPEMSMEIVQNFLAGVLPDKAEGIRKKFDAIRELSKTHQLYIGSLDIDLSPKLVAGKKLRFGGWIRTEGVNASWAGLRCDVFGKQSRLLFSDKMRDRGARGNTPWAYYEIETEVPEDVQRIRIGAFLKEEGSAWFDDFEIFVNGEPYPGKMPFDLSFEKSESGDFEVHGNGYRAAIVEDGAKSKKKSLRLRSSPESLAKYGYEEERRLATEVWKELGAWRNETPQSVSKESWDWAIQNARIVMQCILDRANARNRDESMAENARWILDHAPQGSKMVLWAHNGHVYKAPKWMGGYLNAIYGKDLWVLGFTAKEGNFTALGQGEKLGQFPLLPPEPGSIDWYFSQTGMSRLLFDLHRVSGSEGERSWISDSLLIRDIGALDTQEQFARMNLKSRYDALMFFRETEASRLLR